MMNITKAITFYIFFFKEDKYHDQLFISFRPYDNHYDADWDIDLH
jgi:hypothetical protein